MFGEFHGLPIHALVLHAAVVFAPLASVVSIAFVVPRLRRFLRWPLVLVVAGALATVYVATKSGEVLRGAMGAQLTGTAAGELVAKHERLGQRLLLTLVLLFVLAVIAVGTQPRAGAHWIGHLAPSVLAVVAIAVLALTYQTGEAGAKANWNPTGTINYSGQ